MQTPAIRERMVSGLMNVDAELAKAVAAGLGIREMPEPMPKVRPKDVKPEVSASPALSLFARPGDGGIRSRRVAILVADGCDGAPLVALAERLTAEGAVPRFVGRVARGGEAGVRGRHRGGHPARRRALGAVRRRGAAGRR